MAFGHSFLFLISAAESELSAAAVTYRGLIPGSDSTIPVCWLKLPFHPQGLFGAEIALCPKSPCSFKTKGKAFLFHSGRDLKEDVVLCFLRE